MRSDLPRPVEPQVEVYYFGKWWDAPAFDDAVEKDRPVGEVCGLCEESIEEADSGTWQTFILDTGQEDPKYVYEERPEHIECWLRSGLGSPAHLRRECACYGHEEPADDRSYREQGREVIRMIKTREGIFG